MRKLWQIQHDIELLKDRFERAETGEQHAELCLIAERLEKELEAAEALDDFNYVGSRHHY